jgi:hypothetical protein
VTRNTDGTIPGVNQEIYVRTSIERDTKATVRATVYEELAVHRRYDPFRVFEKDVQWQLTHVRTGLRIPGYYRTKKQARAVAQALQTGEIRWNFDSSTEVSREGRQRASNIIKEYEEEDFV